LVAFGFGYWQRASFEDQLVLFLQPDYRVTQMDTNKRLMTVEGVSESFVVQCQEACAFFVAGGKYRMLYRGNFLEFRKDGRKLKFEIIEIRVKPPAVPGGLG
jgi:hypothetical protein